MKNIVLVHGGFVDGAGWEGCLNAFGISAWHHAVGLLGA